MTRFGELAAWAKDQDLEWEGSRAPTDAEAGRLYIAVRYQTPPDQLMESLARNAFGFQFELFHPK